MPVVIQSPFDRGSAVEWSRTVINDPDTLFLDTETTGLGSSAEIVDIAVLSVDGSVIFESLVQPSRSIPAEATLIHGIHDIDVVTAPPWSEVTERLLPILSDRLIVVYNVDFDRTMVRQCCERCGVTVPRATWTCAMKAYAAFRGHRSKGRSGYKWYNLTAAATAFALPAGEHRARSDAEACRGVVVAMSESNTKS